MSSNKGQQNVSAAMKSKPQKTSGYEKHEKKEKSTLKNTLLITIHVLIFLLAVFSFGSSIVLLVVALKSPYPYVYSDPKCLDGLDLVKVNLTGSSCMRKSFVGVEEWSTETSYIMDDGIHYTHGIMFGVYAPNSLKVLLHIMDNSTQQGSYAYPMRSVGDTGYWFYNVGGVSDSIYYWVDITNKKGVTSRKLVLHGESVEDFTGTQFKSKKTKTSIDWEDFKTLSNSTVPNIMYTVHLPAFEAPGTRSYFDTLTERLDYLQLLGINVIQIYVLEPSICNGEKGVTCWFGSRSLYTGMPNPLFGTLDSLATLLREAHKRRIFVVSSMDFAAFTKDSYLYNYDGSSEPSPFGPLFESDTILIGNSPAARLDLTKSGDKESAGRVFLNSVLRYYQQELGLDGFIWRNFLCFRIKGPSCAQGIGLDRVEALDFIKGHISDVGGIHFADDSEYTVSTDSDLPITKPIDEGGLGIAAIGDFRPFNSIRAFILAKELDATLFEEYLVDVAMGEGDKRIIFYEYLGSVMNNRLGSLLYPSIVGTAALSCKRQAISLFMASLCPGILNLVMGSEYFSEVRLSQFASNLDIDKAGVFTGGEWKKTGASNGLFILVRDLLRLRRDYQTNLSFFPLNITSNPITGVVTFTLQDYTDSLVILNLSNKLYSGKGIDFVFPSTAVENEDWILRFNTDNRMYNSVFDEFLDPISPKACHEGSDRMCGYIQIGAYSIKVLQKSAS